MKKIEYYQKIAKSILNDKENKRRLGIYDAIDIAIKGGNPLPDSVKGLPWMVEYKSASVHDAYSAARKTIASSKVAIDVMPPFANEMNAQDAKIIEDVLEYNFWMTNRKSSITPLYKIADHATRYLNCVVEVIDNYHEYDGSDARSKAIRRSGRFTWKVYDKGTAYPRYSDSIMEDILLVREVTIQDIIEKFGEKNAKAIIRDAKARNKAELMEKTGILYTYWDYDVRVEWFSFSRSFEERTQSYELMNVKNKLGFIPFACAYGEDPILKAVVDTKQLDNLNILLSMRYAIIAATVAQARTWSRTASGEGVAVDYDNPAAQAQLKIGEEVGVLPAPQTDQNINNVINASQSDIAGSTSVSRVLSSLDSMAANTPFSTISALMQSALQSLVDIRQLAERIVEQALMIEMQWVKFTDTPLSGQRLRQVGLYDDTKMIGAMLKVSPEQSEDWPDKWTITVQLRPNSPTDRQERLNYAINSQEKLLISRATAFEIAGIDDDPEVSLMEYGDDQQKIAEIQANAKRILMGPDMEAMQMQQQMQAEMQMQAQTQPPEGGSMARTPATGGTPPAMSNPSATREAITGKSAQMTSGGG